VAIHWRVRQTLLCRRDEEERASGKTHKLLAHAAA